MKPLMKGGHGQLYDINWGALDYASRAPQLDLLHVQMCARAPPPQHKIMQYPII